MQGLALTILARTLRDEVITILTTGAETIAVALAWLFRELGKIPRSNGDFTPKSTKCLTDGPFGAGARLCPGRLFAPTEIAIVAATLGARWALGPGTRENRISEDQGDDVVESLPMRLIARRE